MSSHIAQIDAPRHPEFSHAEWGIAVNTPEIYQTLARYNRWMNEKVYAASAELSDEARKEDRGAFFGSLHSTLNHLLFGDRAWMNRFTDGKRKLLPIGEDLFADFEELRAARREQDQELLEWTAGLTSDWLSEILEWESLASPGIKRQPQWLLVTHMFNHQTHHRGQVTTLLSQCGKDIGRTDLPFLPEE